MLKPSISQIKTYWASFFFCSSTGTNFSSTNPSDKRSGVEALHITDESARKKKNPPLFSPLGFNSCQFTVRAEGFASKPKISRASFWTHPGPSPFSIRYRKRVSLGERIPNSPSCYLTVFRLPLPTNPPAPPVYCRQVFFPLGAAQMAMQLETNINRCKKITLVHMKPPRRPETWRTFTDIQ